MKANKEIHSIMKKVGWRNSLLTKNMKLNIINGRGVKI